MQFVSDLVVFHFKKLIVPFQYFLFQSKIVTTITVDAWWEGSGDAWWEGSCLMSGGGLVEGSSKSRRR